MRNHATELWACDFLSQHTATFTVAYVFVIMEIASRRIVHTNVTTTPTLAWVQGDCFGGGLGIVTACDIALASSTARFCLPEVRLGLTPATISPHVLRAIGARVASRYMLSAERFDALEALRIGVVHAVHPPADLERAVDAMLDALLRGGPAALRETKRLIADFAGAALPTDWLADSATRFADRRSSAEGREGLQAFFDKRAPSWAPPDRD